MEQYSMCELCFYGEKLESSRAWAVVDLTAEMSCGEIKRSIQGFYAGDGLYKVRFMPEIPGEWSYRISGCIQEEGTVEVAPAKGNCDKVSLRDESSQGMNHYGVASCHGMVRAEKLHFCYQDGKLFYPFGTTVYALVHQEDSLVAQTMDSLKESPFNKVRFCVFPKHYDFNHNEPPFYAFEKREDGSWDVNRPCFEFWDRLDKIILQMNEMGIQADLILFHPYDRWGFSNMPQSDNLVYLDHLLRRLAAMPNVWWSLSNEYDLCADKTMENWEEIECFVAEHDPYHHLLSNHNCFKTWDFSRPNVTHACIQTKALTRVAAWREKYQKPVVIDECCYEGNLQHLWGSISGREMTNRFWRVVTMGGYCTHGETFLDPEREVLWWSRGGILKGESPARIGFLRSIVEHFPGPIEPMESVLCALGRLPDKQAEEGLKQLEPGFASFARHMFRMTEEERLDFCANEFIYQGHCGEDVYLMFYDLRTCAQDFLELPKEYTYCVELIDTWEMTRTVLKEKASGRTELKLPGKEGMAVLAVKIK